MYAVIETGGKQIKVEEGQTIYTELLNVEEGSEYVFDKVLVHSDKKTTFGTPYVAGAKVVAEVEKNGKGPKITTFKYVAKKGSTRRKVGHRQPYTRLVIKSIEG